MQGASCALSAGVILLPGDGLLACCCPALFATAGQSNQHELQGDFGSEIGYT